MSTINHLSIYPLIGNADNIKWSAECIADFKQSRSNAFVMGVDDNDEPIFCVSAGEKEYLGDVKINTADIVAVIYYDHSSENLEGGYNKWEMLYIKGGKRGQKYLDKYLANAKENQVVYADIENKTKLKV